MTHEERRRLIEAPLVIERFGGRGWSGTCCSHIGLGFRTQSRSVYYDPPEPRTYEREDDDADPIQK